jgi:hypothetical protein
VCDIETSITRSPWPALGGGVRGGGGRGELDEGDQKYLESFKMWCLRKTGDIGRIDHVKSKKALQRFKEEINIIIIIIIIY